MKIKPWHFLFGFLVLTISFLLYLDLDLLLQKNIRNDHTIEVSEPIFEIQQFLNQKKIQIKFEPKIFAIDRPYWFKSNKVQITADEIVTDLKTWNNLSKEQKIVLLVSCFENNFISKRYDKTNKGFVVDNDLPHASPHSIRFKLKNEMEDLNNDGFVKVYSESFWNPFQYEKLKNTEANLNLDYFVNANELLNNLKTKFTLVLEETIKDKVINKSSLEVFSEVDF